VKIECKDITKKYVLYGTPMDRLKYFLLPNYKPPAFTALENVNLTCYEGEIVGFLGVNGSGKSTLASIIAGITHPDSGELIVNGEAGKLAIGVGLDGQLTGRENIAYKCMLMGYDKHQTKEIEEQAISFAELDLFIDQPIKTYSSGMKARLGFGIAIQLSLDILIIDEALSVGDESFNVKSKNKIYEFKENKRTIVFVSHSLNEMKTFCDKILWLHKGKFVGYGEAVEITSAYKKFTALYSKLTEADKKLYTPVYSEFL